MYIVVTNDLANLTVEFQDFHPGDMDDRIFGPFHRKCDAEEWVDNNCGKQYWTIIKLNHEI